MLTKYEVLATFQLGYLEGKKIPHCPENRYWNSFGEHFLMIFPLKSATKNHGFPEISEI